MLSCVRRGQARKSLAAWLGDKGQREGNIRCLSVAPWLVQMASRYMSRREVFWPGVGVRPDDAEFEVGELLDDAGDGPVPFVWPVAERPFVVGVCRALTR